MNERVGDVYSVKQIKTNSIGFFCSFGRGFEVFNKVAKLKHTYCLSLKVSNLDITRPIISPVGAN